MENLDIINLKVVGEYVKATCDNTLVLAAMNGLLEKYSKGSGVKVIVNKNLLSNNK